MPVAGMPGREGPFASRPGQAALDNLILNNVIIVVIIDETVMRCRQVSQQGGEREQQTDDTRAGHRLICK